MLNLLTYCIFTTEWTLTTDTPIYIFPADGPLLRKGRNIHFLKFLVSQMVSQFVRNQVEISHEYPV